MTISIYTYLSISLLESDCDLSSSSSCENLFFYSTDETVLPFPSGQSAYICQSLAQRRKKSVLLWYDVSIAASQWGRVQIHYNRSRETVETERNLTGPDIQRSDNMHEGGNDGSENSDCRFTCYYRYGRFLSKPSDVFHSELRQNGCRFRSKVPSCTP